LRVTISTGNRNFLKFEIIYGIQQADCFISSATVSILSPEPHAAVSFAQLLLHVSVQGLEDFSKIEIGTAFIVFGNAISDIERTDKGVNPDKKTAGCNQIVEIQYHQYPARYCPPQENRPDKWA